MEVAGEVDCSSIWMSLSACDRSRWFVGGVRRGGDAWQFQPRSSADGLQCPCAESASCTFLQKRLPGATLLGCRSPATSGSGGARSRPDPYEYQLLVMYTKRHGKFKNVGGIIDRVDQPDRAYSRAPQRDFQSARATTSASTATACRPSRPGKTQASGFDPAVQFPDFWRSCTFNKHLASSSSMPRCGTHRTPAPVLALGAGIESRATS